MSDALLQAFANVFDPSVLLVILISAIYGIFVGAVPGLTATMAVALLVPLTFFLSDTAALSAIVTLVACCIFAGDIPGILVRMPGTPASACYTNDSYAMHQKGQLQQALAICLVYSVVGGLVGSIILIAAALPLANIAFLFTTYEYFWLYVLGVSCAAIVSHGSRMKGALALVLGLLFATVGLSDVHSTPRFTFGNDNLITGINFIPAMIGLFGVSEVLRNMIRGNPALGQLSSDDLALREPAWSLAKMLREMLRDAWKRRLGVARSSAIGTAIGILPGAGADIAAWISYGVSKRFSKNPQEYGFGSVQGLAEATCANNSALGGAWIPALVFGIPGDSVTAIVIGVLLMKNITPGPGIFHDPKQCVLVYAIYITFVLANLLLIPIGYVALQAGSYLVRIPRAILMPIILVFSIVGSFAINESTFDVWIMLSMGVLGFVLEMLDVPLGPIVLGMVLGGQLEQSFIQNLTKSDSFLDFVTRPVSMILAATVILLWVGPPVLGLLRREPKPALS